MIVWRFAHKDFVHNAMSGIGSKDTGGRWNHSGTPVVYCCDSIALCLLELQTRVDLDLIPKSYMKLKIILPDDGSVTVFKNLKEIKNYLNPFHTTLSRDYGTKWAKKADTLVLKVPSSVVCEEFNYILNPAHSLFHTIKVKEISELYIDPRALV